MATLRVGTSGWSYRSWVGSFYPPGTGPSRMLAHYGSCLSAVEAHSTQRRVPGPEALRAWTAQVPLDFRFVPKAHANLTHRRDFTGVDDRMASFLTDLAPVGPRLGPILFMLPHRQIDLERLEALVDALAPSPPGPPAVFELAPAWHTDAVRALLSRAGASMALVDREDDSGESRQEPSGPVAYVRLRRSTYTAGELDAWAGRLRSWAAEGRDVYAFVKHDDEGRGPRYATHLVGATTGR